MRHIITKNVNGNLIDMIVTHVDDFQIAGSKIFIDSMLKKLEASLTVSKIERDHYRFTGIDVQKVCDGVELSMEDYAASIEQIKEIRNVKKEEPLLKSELKLFRKNVGKINWFAENTRPDLAIWALNLSKCGSKATIGDLKKLNNVIKKIGIRQSKVNFAKVGKKENLILHAVGDASFKCDGPSANLPMVCQSHVPHWTRSNVRYWTGSQVGHWTNLVQS